MKELAIEELEQRIAPDTLSVTVPTTAAAVSIVPSGGATVNAAAVAADGANGVSVGP